MLMGWMGSKYCGLPDDKSSYILELSGFYSLVATGVDLLLHTTPHLISISILLKSNRL